MSNIKETANMYVDGMIGTYENQVETQKQQVKEEADSY